MGCQDPLNSFIPVLIEKAYIHILIFFLLLFPLQLKVIAIDEQLTVIHEDSVNFEKDLPEFKYVSSLGYPSGARFIKESISSPRA